MAKQKLKRAEPKLRTLTEAAWREEAEQRFGKDPSKWRFVCPACGHVARVDDWRAAGAPGETVAFSCVGRWLPKSRDAFGAGPGPCNYAGGGLFPLNPVTVERAGGGSSRVFEFDKTHATRAPIYEATLDEILSPDLRKRAAEAIRSGFMVSRSTISGRDVWPCWPESLVVELVSFPETGAAGVSVRDDVAWLNADGSPAEVARAAFPNGADAGPSHEASP